MAGAASVPGSRFVARTGRRAIRRLIADLPQPFREAIVLREVNDLSYDEIAAVAGIPVGTVMSRLARARSMLRAAWNRRRLPGKAAQGAAP